MKKKLRKIGKFLPMKLVLYIDYGRSYKKILNLKNPQYFGEKLQWIKLYGNLEQYGKFVDKYEVREFIKEQIGEKYLNEVHGIYDSPDQIKFEELPSKFVIKMTNGTGGNIICKDKSELNILETVKILKKWQKEKLYKYTKEMQYKNVPPRIICEEYLEDETGSLRDYKFYCTKGKVHLIELHTDRFTDRKENYFDLNWNDAGVVCKVGKVENLERPSNLDEMLSIASILSKEFHYVRVDLYSVYGKIYFGELTLTPANGTDPWYPQEKDRELARMIDIDEYRKAIKN